MDRPAIPNPPATALPAPSRPIGVPPSVGLLYVVESLGSVGGNLMQVGIFFYTNRRFGWGLRENFTLAAVQGVVYIAGALLAQGLNARFGPRRVLAAFYAGAGVAGVAALVSGSALGVIGAVLAYTGMMAVTWPVLEAVVAAGADPPAMARRMSTYNVIWAGVGACVLAVNGAIIDFWPPGVFVLTALAHGAAAVLLLINRGDGASREHASDRANVAPTIHAHIDPEPELLQLRTLALWLSRISMPASYALIYALSAMLPSLPPMQRVPTWVATVIGSAWLVSRWLAFLVLGFSPWWHTRPRALLVAAWAMLAAFAALAWQPSSSLGREALALDLGWLVLCQIALGFALGLIYSASLYFGMVLSDGSTEHGGYHEALIGLGSVLGPGVGAVAQWLRPGKLMLGVIAVAGVLALSTLVATFASIAIPRREKPD